MQTLEIALRTLGRARAIDQAPSQVARAGALEEQRPLVRPPRQTCLRHLVEVPSLEHGLVARGERHAEPLESLPRFARSLATHLTPQHDARVGTHQRLDHGRSRRRTPRTSCIARSPSAGAHRDRPLASPRECGRVPAKRLNLTARPGTEAAGHAPAVTRIPLRPS